jgi:hypothetical protein
VPYLRVANVQRGYIDRVRLFWRVGAERDFPVLCP